ncbi:hypothetical protein [Rhizobium leguminosarum]|uniref:hypothetical protein n=1 Tax=Rhizobium leguminosarum TaxID=384 RepID=UPI001C918EC7|nr:hypothetical protein [Rhizobium leguminosarum]MBY2911339.1 hypothetical protein [Rhizobium leguminosarum]
MAVARATRRLLLSRRGYPAPTQPQLVATFCAINNGAFVQQAAGNVRNLVRTGHRSGRVPARKLQIADSLIFLGANGAESSSATVNTYERAIEINGVTTRLLYGGANSMGISGTQWALTDILDGVELPPDNDFFVRLNRSVPLDTNSYIGHALVVPAGQGFRTGGASQLLGTGAMNSSGTAAGPQVVPNGIFGIPIYPMACVGFIGDSIMNYRDSANTAAEGAAWAMAFNNILGSAVPWMKQTQNGHNFGNASMANAPQQKLFWPYLTDIFVELGRNSMPSSGTAAERFAILQAGLDNLLNGARALIGPYGIRLRTHVSTILPDASFDATQDATRALYRDYALTGGAGKIDKGYDTAAVVSPPAGWGTDGTHPPTIEHQAMVPVIREGFAPFLDPYYLPLAA